MSNKLIEIAKANGAAVSKTFFDGPHHVSMTEDQLRATIEHVCSPLVDALKSAYIAMDKGENILKTIQAVKKSIDSHYDIIGDK